MLIMLDMLPVYCLFGYKRINIIFIQLKFKVSIPGDPLITNSFKQTKDYVFYYTGTMF